MLKLLYAILIGIVGAAIVHVVVLLLLPQYSTRDAWQSLAETADFYKAVRLDDGDSAPVVDAVDPLFHASTCRIDLAEGPAHIKAPGIVPFWSVSVYNRAGQNLYSFNDRATDGGVLDVVLLTADQMIEIRKAMPNAYRGAIFVQVPVGQGIVVVRSFVPDPTWESATSDFLAKLSCTKE